MTSNTTFADVKAGDRVRLTGHGEVHEFTVDGVGDSGDVFTSESGYVFCASGDWRVEILEKPLPTGEYAVIGSRDEPSEYNGYYLEGCEWRNAEGTLYTSEEVRRRMREYNLEVLFEGVQK